MKFYSKKNVDIQVLFKSFVAISSDLEMVLHCMLEEQTHVAECWILLEDEEDVDTQKMDLNYLTLQLFVSGSFSLIFSRCHQTP